MQVEMETKYVKYIRLFIEHDERQIKTPFFDVHCSYLIYMHVQLYIEHTNMRFQLLKIAPKITVEKKVGQKVFIYQSSTFERIKQKI